MSKIVSEFLDSVKRLRTRYSENFRKGEEWSDQRGTPSKR